MSIYEMQHHVVDTKRNVERINLHDWKGTPKKRKTKNSRRIRRQFSQKKRTQ